MCVVVVDGGVVVDGVVVVEVALLNKNVLLDEVVETLFAPLLLR